VNSTAKEAVSDILKKVFKPKEKLKPSDWVEGNIRLSSFTTTLHGQYSLRHTPYLRQLYDDIGNPRVRKIVLKKSAQIGATQFANNVILYYVCNFALNILMFMPSQTLAQQFCERSLTPTIHASPVVGNFLTGNEDDLKKTDFLFTSCIARVIGAGSPSRLSSNPAAIVIVDEADKLKDFASEGEAPALQLAEARTISFPNEKKILVMGTPTEENSSVIHSEFLKGSQSYFYVTCPSCNLEQILRFENVRGFEECKLEDGSYDLDLLESKVYYQCSNPECKAHLNEQSKIEMVRKGRWKDHNPKATEDKRSYHISALYSFNITLGSLAKMFLLAKDDIGLLRDFYNSYLGECFAQRASTIKRDHVDLLVKESPYYLRGELLSKPDAVLMAVDTQGDNFWYGIEALYPDGSSSVVEWGPAETFDDLALISQRKFKVRGSDESYPIKRALIDMGGTRTEQVKDFCYKSLRLFWPVIGRVEANGFNLTAKEEYFNFQGKNVLPGLKINDRTFKDILYIRNIRERAGRFYLPSNTDDELRIQLSSEHLVERKVRGRIETEWRCTNRRNHLGDCFKYLEGLKYLLIPMFEEHRQKERLRAAIRPEEPSQQVRDYALNPWN